MPFATRSMLRDGISNNTNICPRCYAAYSGFKVASEIEWRGLASTLDRTETRGASIGTAKQSGQNLVVMVHAMELDVN